MNTKALNQNIIDRLLVAKRFLGKIRSLSATKPDRYTIAHHVLTAHDAAELAIASIVHHLGLTPKSQKTFLMDYFPLIKEKYPDKEIPGREFFSQLNIARTAIKHSGVFPDSKQWVRVGENTYNYVSTWCSKYLGISFETLDESDMIINPDIKKLYNAAKKASVEGNYRAVIEKLALGLHSAFESNRAVPNITVGTSNAEDALKLSAFGVSPKDFLTLQEFLPSMYHLQNPEEDGQITFDWKYDKFWHPANWREDTAEFCLKAFVDIVLRVQDAEWTPSAIDFNTVYEYEITAQHDGAELWDETRGILASEKITIKIFKKGDSLRGNVYVEKKDLAKILVAHEMGVKPIQESKEEGKLNIVSSEGIGFILEKDFKIKCVPRKHATIKEYFSDLPSLTVIFRD